MINSLYKCFRHWSKSGSVYIISDPHFEDIDCKLMDPNWISPEEHIKILKEKVHKDDTLICLGDCGNPKWFSQLRCYKVLIKGNHDVGSEKYSPFFEEVYEGPLFISDKILLSHEPILNLPFVFNIHGHDHSGVEVNDECHLNLASNVVKFNIVSLSDIIKQGYLSHIDNIHRKAIDKATERKQKKEFNKGEIKK